MSETINIPDDVDPNSFRQAIESIILEARERSREDRLSADVLTSDVALVKWLKQNDIRDMVVRASLYPSITYGQELSRKWGNDLRRPVVMKGARSTLIINHSNSGSPNGWCRSVFDRWLKMKKVTAFGYQEYHDQVDGFLRRCRQKHRVTHHFKSEWPGDLHNPVAMVAGKFVFLSNHQRTYIAGLNALRNKSAELECKIAALDRVAGRG